jgi:primosomal protein N' (replication factor Y)
MLLESETEMVTHQWITIAPSLSKHAQQLLQQLEQNTTYSLAQVQQLLLLKNPYPVLHELTAAAYVSLKEEVYARYQPKLKTEICLDPAYKNEDALKDLLGLLAAKPKQYKTLLTFLQQKAPVWSAAFSSLDTVTVSSVNTLVKNNVLQKHKRCGSFASQNRGRQPTYAIKCCAEKRKRFH